MHIRRLPPTGSLEAFVAAARAGSLRKASADLNLSVSALSRRVQKLEQHTGQPLFSRNGNEYLLNSEGRRLLAAIENPLDQITAALAQSDTPGLRKLTVGVPTSFATTWLIPRLAKFRQLYPDVELRLDTSGAPTEKLGKSIDIIIFFAENDAERIAFKPLRPQGAMAIAREGLVDPLMGLRANLERNTLLVHRHLPQILPTWLAAMKLSPDMPLKIEMLDDGPLLVAEAKSGLGLALVLEDMVNFYGDASGLVRPFGEYVRTPFSYAMAIQRASGNAGAIERFRDWIVRETAEERQHLILKEGAGDAYAAPAL